MGQFATELPSTESLAAPLLQETRQRFNEQLAAKDAEVARKTEALRKEQDAVARAREQIEDQVAQRLTAAVDQYVAQDRVARLSFIRSIRGDHAHRRDGFRPFDI